MLSIPSCAELHLSVPYVECQLKMSCSSLDILRLVLQIPLNINLFSPLNAVMPNVLTDHSLLSMLTTLLL